MDYFLQEEAMDRKFLIVLFVSVLNISFNLPMQNLAYSQPIKSNPGREIRGVWMYPGFFSADSMAAHAKIKTTLNEYLEAGINTLVMLVKSTSGQVYFKSQIAPADPAVDWDFFGIFLQEAKQRNMIVHPWFCIFPEGGMVGTVRQHPEWLIRSKKGELVTTVNPALPEVRQYEISLMLELVQQYSVDWIHLDYLRYPCEPTEVYFSFDAQTRALFKNYSGEDPMSWKSYDSGNLFWNEWIEWNAGQVTQFIRELRAALKSVTRPIKISAAVFPDAANARVLIGQDWASWTEQGLIDMLCPMLYTNHYGFFEKYVRRAIEIVRGHCQMCAGIGIGTVHNQNTPEGMMEQFRISRKLGADGVIFFSSNSLKQDFLEKLKTMK